MGTASEPMMTGGHKVSDQEAAIFNLRCVIKKNPNDARAQLQLGVLLSESDHEAALRTLRTALSLALRSPGEEGAQLRHEATLRLIEIMHQLENS
jgi:hypothetical protein